MESSRQADSGVAWVELRRLRDVSGLVLVAIERDDLDEVGRLANESARLIETISGSLPSMDAKDPGAPSDTIGLLDAVRAMNARIVARLGERMRDTAREIGGVRGRSSRLRSSFAAGPCIADAMDRDS